MEEREVWGEMQEAEERKEEEEERKEEQWLVSTMFQNVDILQTRYIQSGMEQENIQKHY